MERYLGGIASGLAVSQVLHYGIAGSTKYPSPAHYAVSAAHGIFQAGCACVWLSKYGPAFRVTSDSDQRSASKDDAIPGNSRDVSDFLTFQFGLAGGVYVFDLAKAYLAGTLQKDLTIHHLLFITGCHAGFMFRERVKRVDWVTEALALSAATMPLRSLLWALERSNHSAKKAAEWLLLLAYIPFRLLLVPGVLMLYANQLRLRGVDLKANTFRHMPLHCAVSSLLFMFLNLFWFRGLLKRIRR